MLMKMLGKRNLTGQEIKLEKTAIFWRLTRGLEVFGARRFGCIRKVKGIVSF